MPMDLSKDEMKERVINYLEYMEEKDLRLRPHYIISLNGEPEIKQRKENGG